MSCIWVSAQECSRQELLQLAELMKNDSTLKIILSSTSPFEGGGRTDQEARISELLVRLGIKANLKGFLYLKTAVKLAMKDREELDGITKRLYPSVARAHAASTDRVEHAIRHKAAGRGATAGNSARCSDTTRGRGNGPPTPSLSPAS
ncbi:MAG: sporulation initiation factor Spo0A C-terminal domain-containing protein [Eubacteriales bacterium]|nr:sporulation initiation factor Spo0A C-terminal domain-containing protein [Eubacteriales bacterium]